MALAQQIVQEFGSLYHIMTASKAAFSGIKGVGSAIACSCASLASPTPLMPLKAALLAVIM
jgi:DNA repair protein RadC